MRPISAGIGALHLLQPHGELTLPSLKQFEHVEVVLSEIPVVLSQRRGVFSSEFKVVPKQES